MKTLTLILCLVPAALAADWSPRRAADYLDARQKAWMVWPRANLNGLPCISCHTGAPYLLARPLLRKALGESGISANEATLLNTLRTDLGKRTPHDLRPKKNEPGASQDLGVESIFAALFLSREDPAGPAAAQALDRMWSVQLKQGPKKGAWNWFLVDLDPWENDDAPYFGAVNAAAAIVAAGPSYRNRPELKSNIDGLKQYLNANQASQPLHNRLQLARVASDWPDLIPAATRKSIIKEALTKQQPDGGWTRESLGKWKARPNAPSSEGSDSYATAVVLYSLNNSGKKNAAQRKKAAEWLKSHQTPEGYWEGASMNKRYEPDSMMVSFMRDAATSYATLALLGQRN